MIHVRLVPQPCLALWEEMGARVFQPRGGKSHINLFVTHVLLWRRQVDIEVAGHQELCPMEALDDGPQQQPLWLRRCPGRYITPLHVTAALPTPSES